MGPVTLVVVNYNGGAALSGLVESLMADHTTPARLLIVDNASTDESGTYLSELEARGDPEVIRLNRNVGYAGAVNRALPRIDTEYVGVLNMDLSVEPGWLSPLVAFLNANTSVAAANPLIRTQRGGQISAAGQRLHVSGLGFNQTALPPGTDGHTPFEVPGIHGAAFVVRTEVLRELGGMDESGFLYHEDVNLSWLLRLRGHRLCCVPESVVYHDYFLSMYPEKFYLLERNRLAMLLGYLRWSTLCALSPALAATEALTWGYAAMRGVDFLKAKGASYRWVLQHRDGILARRRWLQAHRRVSDWAVLAHARIGYDLAQMVTLARERGPSARVPVGGPTIELE